MINAHWLELPLSRTNFHGPKSVRVIEVLLYNSGLTWVYSYLCSHSITSFYIISSVQVKVQRQTIESMTFNLDNVTLSCRLN